MPQQERETLATKQNPWESQESGVRELAVNARPVDYEYIFEGSRLLFLADNHTNDLIRLHVIQHAADFRRLGATHYTVEAPDNYLEIYERFNRGEIRAADIPDVGPSEYRDRLLKAIFGHLPPKLSARHGYVAALEAIRAQGIEVLPIDIDQSTHPSEARREWYIATNLQALLEDPTHRVVSLHGAAHTSRTRRHKSGALTVNQRLMRQGISTVNIGFTGELNYYPVVETVVERAALAGLRDREFMLDMKAYAAGSSPRGAGEADFIVHFARLNKS